MATTVLRSCNLCEAGCGLKLTVEDNRITAVAPDEDDPQSRGFVFNADLVSVIRFLDIGTRVAQTVR